MPQTLTEDTDRGEIARAWAVHILTASGAVLGFLALVTVIEGDLRGAFLWLGLALAVDGIDGTLARRARVREVTPQVDGATLDNIIDYVTYVVVPALMIYWYGFVPEGWALPAAAAITGVSCYTFANAGMKSDDFHFVGFPALWNVVVLSMHVLALDPWVNLGIIALCGVLTFLPFAYVHPFRVVRLRRTTLAVTGIWSALTLGIVWVGPAEADPVAINLWIAASLWFVAVSAWRTVMGPGEEDDTA